MVWYAFNTRAFFAARKIAAARAAQAAQFRDQLQF